MFAYRAEVWCDGLSKSGKVSMCPHNAGSGKGIAHDNYMQLPTLAVNRERILLGQSWVKWQGKHYCPDCAQNIPRIAA